MGRPGDAVFSGRGRSCWPRPSTSWLQPRSLPLSRMIIAGAFRTPW